jgi:hypothetical protein
MSLESVSMVEMVNAPAHMPVHYGESTPSRGGREDINGTGVSCCPESFWRNASFCIIPLVKKEQIQINHQLLKGNNF